MKVYDRYHGLICAKSGKALFSKKDAKKVHKSTLSTYDATVSLTSHLNVTIVQFGRTETAWSFTNAIGEQRAMKDCIKK